QLLVRNITVYRGTVLLDEKPIANYKKVVTIITTTFLSTSTDPVGNMISISIFCTYNNNNTRCTALNPEKLTNFEHEQ
ncbi:unnamed protein product, partial [Rotaria sp. Silwood2]